MEYNKRNAVSIAFLLLCTQEQLNVLYYAGKYFIALKEACNMGEGV